MAQEILYRCIIGEIPLEELYTWILHETNPNELKACSRGEFVSHFLNFIHEISISSNLNTNTPQALEHTPKSIKPPRDVIRPRRRPALFSDSSSDSCVTSVNVSVTGDTSAHAQSYQQGTGACPESPLYSNTPNKWRNQPMKQSTPVQNKKLCLGDFISSSSGRKSATKKKGQKTPRDNETQLQKRINPIVFNNTTNNPNTNSNSFNFENIEKPTAEESNSNIVNTNLASMVASVNINIDKVTDTEVTPVKSVEIQPDMSKVTLRRELDSCSSIYVFLIKNKLMLNLLSELYFVITLLLSRKYLTEDIGDLNTKTPILTKDNLKILFDNVHNVVYFAARILGELTDVVRIFDRATVKFLLDNARIAGFVTKIKDLESIYNVKLSTSLVPSHHPPSTTTTTSTTVHFLPDTDGRSNFSSDQSFHSFRRQRDSFYNLLRQWQAVYFGNDGSPASHHTGSFNMVAQVKSMLALNVAGDEDYRHLARLFRGQMVNDCCGTQNTPPTQDTSSSLLSALPQLNPDKLALLRSRLTTRQSTSSSAYASCTSLSACPTTSLLNTSPTFPGQQEFYREFILAADCASWQMHLRDAFVSELVGLDRMEWEGDVKDDTEEEGATGGKKDWAHQSSRHNHKRTQATVSLTLYTARLLAKFLGLLDSLPYVQRTGQVQQKHHVASAAEPRQYYQPSLDLIGCLEGALERGGLTLTVPWLVEYCAMLDGGVMRVKYYERLFQILFEIYQNMRSISNNGSDLITLCLGWLFELPQFPSEFYYSWYNKRTTDTAKKISNDSLKGVKQPTLSLDQLDIIDEAILYATCPYLGEFRRLLLSNHSWHNNVTVKHITPVTAADEKNSEVTERKLKMQLEEAFFNAQAGSVRKIVDFVSDRVASSSVKIICNKIVPNYRQSAALGFKSSLNTSNFTETDVDKLRVLVESESKEFQSRSLKYLQILCSTEAKRLIQDRVSIAVGLLLSGEELPQTRLTSGDIAARICYERVQEWIQNHVNIGVLSKDFHSEVEKFVTKRGNSATLEGKLTFALPSDGRNINHNSDTLNAVAIVEIIKTVTISTIEKSPNVTKDVIDKMLIDASDTLTQRCDVNDCILFLINKLLLDLLIILVAQKTDLITNSLILDFMDFWTKHCFVQTSTSNTSKLSHDITLDIPAQHTPIKNINTSASFELNSSSNAPLNSPNKLISSMRLSSGSKSLTSSLNDLSSCNTPTKKLMLSRSNSNKSISKLNSSSSRRISSPINVSSSNALTGTNVMERLFVGIVCPRNVIILSKSMNDRPFKVFAAFVVELLKRELISSKELEEQIVALYKQDWSDVILRNISVLLKELVDGCRDFKTGPKFILLMDILVDLNVDF